MRGSRNYHSTFLLSLLLLLVPSSSKIQGIEQGRIIAKVVCQYDRSQSYALYVPSAYTPERRWPIIYAFDPAARGVIPVNLFHEAAERYGYILVGSNNARNGPWEDNVRAANAIWSDSHIHFSIDDGRIYAAGFSGGARMASGLSHLLKKPVTGIIACGAGLPNWLKPGQIAPAAFFGIVGLADMNYKELKRIDKEFDSLNTAHRVRTFDGPHDWPPKRLCEEAAEWMEFQAIKAGRRENEEGLLEGLFQRGLDKARQHEESGNMHEAFQIYEALKDDYSGMVDVSKAEAGAEHIKSRPDFKTEHEQEKLALEEELVLAKRLRENFWQLKAKIADPSERENLLKRFQLDNLLEIARNTHDFFRCRMAKRLLQDFSTNVYEQGEISIRAKEYAWAAVCFELIAVSSSRHPDVLYKLASVYSLNNDRNKALRTLQEAVEKGFTDRKRLNEDGSFDPIRDDTMFKAILDSMKKDDSR